MLTGKQRAELRTQANGIETTLMVGKGGVTPNVIAEAEILLESRELVKGRVLETALMSAREVSDEICEATGAEGIQRVGSKFVIWRKSKKLEQQAREKAAREKKKAAVNPVKAGVQKRRKERTEAREKKNEYFKQVAIQHSIERERARKQRQED